MASEVPGPRSVSVVHGGFCDNEINEDAVSTVQSPVRGPERPSFFYLFIFLDFW